MVIEPSVLAWLLDSDPAIRWQVLKDLQHAPPPVYDAERARLAEQGWCARLLRFQDDDGLWNRRLYNGKWLSTTYTLYLLKLLGLPPGNPQALLGCAELLEQGLFLEREIRFSHQMEIADLGVTALVLSLCCYFGMCDSALPHVARFLAGQQQAAGCWYPNDAGGASDYAFETTLLVLEALLQFTAQCTIEYDQEITMAIAQGQEFLLRSRLFLDKDDHPLKPAWVSFSFPAYWFYDVLTALEYFRAFQANRDPRLQPAIDLLLKHRSEAGAWLLGSRHHGKTYFDMETSGEPSRWNTLRALRVLDWWQRG